MLWPSPPLLFFSSAPAQDITLQTLITEVAEQQKQLAAKVVPWYLKSMPAAYFRQVPEGVRSQHIKAITALRDLKQSDLSLKIETKTDNSLQVTFINSQTTGALLNKQIKNLVVPAGYDLTKVNVFNSVDGELSLNLFTFTQSATTASHATRAHATKILEVLAEIKAGKHAGDARYPEYNEAIFSDAALDAYLVKTTPSYATNSDPRRFLIQREMYEKVRGTDGSVVQMEALPGETALTWITIAAANVLPEVLLRLSSNIIAAKGLDINRAHLDSVNDPENSTKELAGQVTMLRLLVSPNAQGKDLNTDKDYAKSVAQDLKRSKWIDNQVTELGLNQFPQLGINKAEVIVTLASMLHGPLYKEDANTYASIKSILQLITSHANYVNIADSIATLFLERFNPANPLSQEAFNARSEEIRKKISVSGNVGVRRLLNKMLDGVHATLRTNFYNEERYAHALRLNPTIMMPGGVATPERPLPFGVFFIHGRNFNAFHNRFRDIARGGLRIVTPANSDLYALESSRQYDEVYGLSYAQQLKNKDIPEGGSKGVLLVNTPALEDPNTKFFAMRKAVRGCCDAMLDLIVKDTVSKGVDLYGKDELIYLGPDEQIIPSDIEWIIKRAGQRGYPIPAAFMSSKAEDGFNHKEFGVTSEGVVVCLDVAVRKVLGIDPHKQPFTVKVTGGPDGDVAGNLMKILYRDYGKNAKVVAVADGFGVAEDPDGLDADEMMRLVRESKSIDHFNKAKLGPKGIVLSASTEEGALRRNTMHFRVKSDVFVPAGGRPNTINGDNWQQFLDESGKPSSPLIVEGANIFNTAEARKNLFEKAGVIIVKDSSANKCGVMTSSYEVASSMLLTKQEFMSIKPELVSDVLVRLRGAARAEAELLFREFENHPGSLVHFSERISAAIAKVTDAITDALADVQPEDALFKELVPLIREDNLPKKLADVAGDRIGERYPVQYQRNAIASTLASKLVYKEGIHLIESQPAEKIAERAFAYYRADKKIQKVIADLEKDEKTISEHKSVVMDVLKCAGARAQTSSFA